MLNKEEDLKFDVLDRFMDRDILDEEVFRDTVSELAFVTEDELRASARMRFLDISMWSDIIMPYIEDADYKEIANIWLSKTRESRIKTKENADA